jgi:hypothetical protein
MSPYRRKLDRGSEQNFPAQAPTGHLPPDTGRRARAQLWAFVFFARGRLLELLIVLGRSGEKKESELLALRNEVVC